MKKQGKGKLETFEQTVKYVFTKNMINPDLFFFFLQRRNTLYNR